MFSTVPSRGFEGLNPLAVEDVLRFTPAAGLLAGGSFFAVVFRAFDEELRAFVTRALLTTFLAFLTLSVERRRRLATLVFLPAVAFAVSIRVRLPRFTFPTSSVLGTGCT